MRMRTLFLILLTPCDAFAQQTDGAFTSDGMLTAVVTVIAGLIAAAVSLAVSRYTIIHALNSERIKRQAELALTISQAVSSQDENTRKSAMRRFAVGLVKLVEPETHALSGQVYFIPMNSRVTVGRETDNDIVLDDGDRVLSRWHCGFMSDQANVLHHKTGRSS